MSAVIDVRPLTCELSSMMVSQRQWRSLYHVTSVEATSKLILDIWTAVHYTGTTMKNKQTPAPATISLMAIADEIENAWPKVHYAARPYLDAMHSLNLITDMYFCDSAKSIVLYFLSNASTWRGETAKRIKAELKAMAGVK